MFETVKNSCSVLEKKNNPVKNICFFSEGYINNAKKNRSLPSHNVHFSIGTTIHIYRSMFTKVRGVSLTTTAMPPECTFDSLFCFCFCNDCETRQKDESVLFQIRPIMSFCLILIRLIPDIAFVDPAHIFGEDFVIVFLSSQFLCCTVRHHTRAAADLLK